MADHDARWKRYVDAVAELARVGGGAEGILRAMDFQLEACHFMGADREASVEGLRRIEALLREGEGAREEELAAARGAVLLGEAELLLASDAEAAAAKVREGLAALANCMFVAKPDLQVIRRHNDLVTLAKLDPKLGVEAYYHLVKCTTPHGLEVSIPLSRAWRTLDWTSKVTGETVFEFYRLDPAGDHLSRVRFNVYRHGMMYPRLLAKKQADASKPNKLAAALYESDKEFGLYKASKKRKRSGPKRTRLNDQVRTAYVYEVLSLGYPKVRPWYQRLRVWIFSGKDQSYGIRVNDWMSDGVEGLHPELEAMLQSVRGQ